MESEDIKDVTVVDMVEADSPVVDDEEMAIQKDTGMDKEEVFVPNENKEEAKVDGVNNDFEQSSALNVDYEDVHSDDQYVDPEVEETASKPEGYQIIEAAPKSDNQSKDNKKRENFHSYENRKSFNRYEQATFSDSRPQRKLIHSDEQRSRLIPVPRKSPNRMRYPGIPAINSDSGDLVYCVARNVHELDIALDELGLLEYVDNAALVHCCQLAPELTDIIIDRFKKTCSKTITNPSSYLMSIASQVIKENNVKREVLNRNESYTRNNGGREERVRSRSRSRSRSRNRASYVYREGMEREEREYEYRVERQGEKREERRESGREIMRGSGRDVPRDILHDVTRDVTRDIPRVSTRDVTRVSSRDDRRNVTRDIPRDIPRISNRNDRHEVPRDSYKTPRVTERDDRHRDNMREERREGLRESIREIRGEERREWTINKGEGGNREYHADYQRSSREYQSNHDRHY